MTDETKLRQQIERGERAQRILDNDLVREFFETYERQIFETFKQSDISDDKGHRNCRLHMKVFADFQRHFESYVRTGEMAHRTLKDTLKRMARHGRR